MSREQKPGLRFRQLYIINEIKYFYASSPDFPLCITAILQADYFIFLRLYPLDIYLLYGILVLKAVACSVNHEPGGWCLGRDRGAAA